MQKTVSVKELFSSLFLLIRLMPPKYRWQLLALFFLQITSSLLEIISIGAIIPFLNVLANFDSFINNQYVSYVLQNLGIQDKIQVVILASALFVGAFACSNILKILLLWFQRRLAALINVELSRLVYTKMLYMSYPFFLKNNSSELIGNLTHDLRASFGSVQAVLLFVANGIMTISIVTSLLFYDPFSAIGLLGICIASYILITLLVRPRLNRNGVVESTTHQAMLKVLQESLGSMRYVILNGNYNIFIREYRKKYYQYKMAKTTLTILRQAPRFFVEIIGVLAICSLTILFSIKNSNLEGYLPFLGFIAMGSHRLISSVNQCYNAIGSIISTNFSLQKIVKLLCSSEQKKRTYRTLEHLSFEQELSFNGVFFRYEERAQKNWILSDLSFTIKAKSTVAIVGSTGSGKSTLADIILGLISPNRGYVSIDGQILDKSNMERWQSCVAHVPQSIFMADVSIAENIALGIPAAEIDEKWLQCVAKQAQIHNFIKTLPDKYETLVGERGVRLSGGQVQRIGIARALYKKPQLIIFDEATSALDSATEKAVIESIYNISNEQMLIIIAHRLSTVKNADTILVLEQGQLVAQGTHGELLKQSTTFQNLTGVI